MGNDFYYIKLYFNSKSISEKNIFSFLNSLNKVKEIEFFYSFLDSAGFAILKKMKKIQEENKFKFSGNPIISNKEEKKLLVNYYPPNEYILLIVVKNKEHIKNIIDGIIRDNKKFFFRINKRITRIENIDIVTPLNMRGEQNILKLSFLISKCAIDLINIKKESWSNNFPNMFFGVALIFDLIKKNKRQRLFKKIIYDYFLYLLNYFELNKEERLSLDRASKKYIRIIEMIDKKELGFQQNKKYLDLVNELYKLLLRNKVLIKVKKKPRNFYWMFYHWFNNSLNVNFTQEVSLVFILKNFYENKKL